MRECNRVRPGARLGANVASASSPNLRAAAAAVTGKGAEMSQIRNVAVLSHSGAGKTSLTEAILYRAGAIPSMGKGEEGTTRSDYTPEEKRRKISIWCTLNRLACRARRCTIR